MSQPTGSKPVSAAARSRAARARGPVSGRGRFGAGLVVLIAAAASAGCNRGFPRAASEPSNLNVVVVSFDALRADALPTYGYPRETAPTIARFAQNALVYDRAYAAASSTPPSFAAAFSGRYPHKVFQSWRFTAEPTLASVFDGAGYATAFFSNNIQLTPERGFDRGFGTYRILPHDRAADEDADGAADDEQVLSAGLTWLEGNRGRPFLLWLHFLSPHSPYTYRELSKQFYDSAYEGPYRETTGHTFSTTSNDELMRVRDLYDGEVFYADDLFRRVLARLDELELRSRTVLVLTSDHGEEFLEHGRLQHALPHEEVARIPLLVRHPDLSGTRRVSMPVSNADLLPSLAAWLGVPAPGGLDGAPLDPDPPSGRPVYSVSMTTPTARAVAMIGLDDKVILHCSDAAATLFNLVTDPLERTDLSTERAAVLEDILARGAKDMGGEPCGVIVQAATGRKPPELDPDTVRRLRSLGYAAPGNEPAAASDAAPKVEPTITADPDRITVCDGSGLGTTRVSWTLTRERQPVEVRVAGPGGNLLAQANTAGSAPTGKWVRDGTAFYLIDSATRRVLARHQVQVTSEGCAPAPSQ